MPERHAHHGRGGLRHFARAHGQRAVGQTAGLHTQCKSAGHRHRVAGLGHCGVNQHGVITQFHHLRGVVGGADAGIDYQHAVGQALAQGAQCGQVARPGAGADGRGPGHDGGDPDVTQLERGHQIVGGVGEHGEALTHQSLRGGHGAPGIGLQGVVVADDFELDPVSAENFARHLRHGDGLFRGVTTGGVG